MSKFSSVVEILKAYHLQADEAYSNLSKHIFANEMLKKTLDEATMDELQEKYLGTVLCSESAPIKEMIDSIAGYRRSLIIRNKSKFAQYAIADAVRHRAINVVLNNKVKVLEGD